MLLQFYAYFGVTYVSTTFSSMRSFLSTTHYFVLHFNFALLSLKSLFPRYFLTTYFVFCTSFQDVVKAFYSTQHTELQSVLEKHNLVFQEDGNSGLVAQVVVARQKTSIKRLTKTFLTLSLEDVASRVGLASPAEAENQLVSMIEEGSIFARISQKDGERIYYRF